ncbi:MAG: DUF4340 domain-containing protein [Desulfobacterales bacterium]|nr:DUF4340 domain-containing protein [Desulfobacterales bacterium]
MKSKKEYIILIAVAIVLIMYLLLHQSDRTLYQLPEMPDLSEKEISRLEIKTPDETIELKKEAGQWVIKPQGYKAAGKKIDKMIDTLKDFQLTALVSESKSYTRYELSPDKKIMVKAWAGGETVRTFAVGKAAPSNRHTFVKLPDNPNVYHARNNFRRNFDQRLADLRDKTVLALKADEIQAVEINDTDRQLKIARTQTEAEVDVSSNASEKTEKTKEDTPEKPVWQDTKGNEVEASQVEDLLNSLSGLKCKSFINDREKSDFTDPIYEVTLTGPETHTLSIFEKAAEEDNTYPAVSSGSQHPFNLSAQKAESIMEAIDEE